MAKIKKGPFFTIQVENKKDPIEIHNDQLLNFISEEFGYKLYMDYTSSYTLVKVTKNSIVEEARLIDIKQDLRNYLIKNNNGTVLKKLLKNNTLNDKFIEYLPRITDINFNVSNKEEAYLFYKNIIVKITKSKISFIAYEDFEGKVWKEQIIKRNLTLINGNPYEQKSVFQNFLFLICKRDTNRFYSLASIIGYLLHPYKDASNTKAVILLDEKIDFGGAANGGTGKSIIARALENITPTVWKDGKKYNSKETFVFDDIRPHHRLLYFDDVKKDFSFEEFYSLITGKLKVSRKYKDSSTIPFSLTPKLLISSNYMVRGSGGQTDERRRIEFEIASYFSIDHTPKDEFNHILFDEWDNDEWARFDHFMIDCIRFYISKGIRHPESINLKYNKLVMSTDLEFVHFMEEFESFGRKVCKKELYTQFISLHPSKKIITSITFKKWIDLWAEHNGHDVSHLKSNSKNYIIITKKKLLK